MHLRTPRASRDKQARFDDATTRLVPPPARDLALAWLIEKVVEGQLALDPFDSSLVVLNAEPCERVWGYRALELCGFVESRYDRPGGGQRITASLQIDVRRALGFERPDAPVMENVGLASRTVDATSLPAAVTISELADPMPAPAFRLLEFTGEPVHSAGMTALHNARAAYEKSVH